MRIIEIFSNERDCKHIMLLCRRYDLYFSTPEENIIKIHDESNENCILFEHHYFKNIRYKSGYGDKDLSIVPGLKYSLWVNYSPAILMLFISFNNPVAFISLTCIFTLLLINYFMGDEPDKYFMKSWEREKYRIDTNRLKK